MSRSAKSVALFYPPDKLTPREHYNAAGAAGGWLVTFDPQRQGQRGLGLAVSTLQAQTFTLSPFILERPLQRGPQRKADERMRKIEVTFTK